MNKVLILNKIREHYGLSKNVDFANFLGITPQALSNWYKRETYDLDILFTKCEGFSSEWLISGNGPMLKSDLPCATKSEYLSNQGIPLIPVSAFAGIANGEVSVLEYECERYIIPLFKDAEFLIPVKGSSMIPKYSSGDIVACKKLSLNDIFFQWNKVYVLDTDQGVMVKRVHKSPDPDHIKIVSENPKYEPFDLHISKIHAIAIVIGVVRLE